MVGWCAELYNNYLSQTIYSKVYLPPAQRLHFGLVNNVFGRSTL
jgi:hypothetical protein